MIRKVAKVLLVIVLLSNNILGATNLASAMSNTAEVNVSTPITEENVTVEAENNSTAITSEAEENSIVVPGESNSTDAIEENVPVKAGNDSTAITSEAEDNSTVVQDESSKPDTIEDNSTAASTESNISDKNESESQTPSSDSINSTVEVQVSDDKSLRDAVKNDGTKIKLLNDITLEEPLVISGSGVVIDGDNKKIVLHEGATNNNNGFVIKPVIKDTKVKNVELRNVTFENYSLNAISLLNAESVLIEKVTLKGKSNSNIIKSNVGIDLDESTATIKDIVSMNHDYAGIRVRNESQLTLGGWNEHTNDKKDLQLVSGTVTDENNNYTPAWNNDSTFYKVKTKMIVNDLTKFEKAIAIENTAIELSNDIEINKNIEIKSKNITINGKKTSGDNHQIIIKSNSPEDDSKNTSSLAVKSENMVLENLTIINETTNKPGLTLYGAKNPKLTNITIEGIDPNNNNGRRSGVALDIYNTKVAELKDITCKNSLYRDFQVRGGSTVKVLSENKHSSGIVHMQTIKKNGEADNKIIDESNFYIAGKAFEENGDTKVDYFLKQEVPAKTFEDILKHIQTGGAVIKLDKNITVDEADALKDGEIEVGRNVTIDGNGHTLNLNRKAKLILKGKDIVVKNLTVTNSSHYGINIYNSKNVSLEKVNVENSKSHGIFVNGSIVDLKDCSTSSNGAEGIKITRSRTLNSASHFSSEVTVKGNLTQKESTISVIVVDLDMINKDGSILKVEENDKLKNKFIDETGTYRKYENEKEYKKLSQEQIDYFKSQGYSIDETKGYGETTTDYLVSQEDLIVTEQQEVKDENGDYIHLDNGGVTDNTQKLIKLIEYAALHSKNLVFPEGTYKITDDIDLSKLNLPPAAHPDALESDLPAASNFRLIGDPNGLSIIDGSSNLDKMLRIFNETYHAKMSYVDIEHLVFNNVGIDINGPYKKGISLKNNVFMNGNYTREKRDDGTVWKATMEPYVRVKNSKYAIENNVFLRGQNFPGRGISTYATKNTTIKNNFFGDLNSLDHASGMLPKSVIKKASQVKSEYAKSKTLNVNGEQGNFFTAINNERLDTNVTIENNYFDLEETRNVTSDFGSDILIGGINVSKEGQRRDHIIYSKGYNGLNIVRNYFKGQENDASGGVKIRNGANAYIGSNYFKNVPLLTYIYGDLNKAEGVLHNTTIYNNLFHETKRIGEEGTGILYYQSFRDGEEVKFRDETVAQAYGDVKNFVMYKNQFLASDRSEITISGRPSQALGKGEFVAHGNVYYDDNNVKVSYDKGNKKLEESDEKHAQSKLNDGYDKFNQLAIPLMPPAVDYTELDKSIVDAEKYYETIKDGSFFNDEMKEELKNLIDEAKELEKNNANQWQVNDSYIAITELLKKYQRMEEEGKNVGDDNMGVITPSKPNYDVEDDMEVDPDKIPSKPNYDVEDDNMVGNTPSKPNYDTDDEMGVVPDGGTVEDGTDKDNNTVTPETEKPSTKPEDKPESDKPDAGGNDNVTGPGNGTGSGGEDKPEVDGSGGANTPGDEVGPGNIDNSEDGNTPGSGKEESIGGTVNKPTVDEQEKLDSLPQTGEVFNRVLTAVGILLIIAAGVLLMKRSKTE